MSAFEMLSEQGRVELGGVARRGVTGCGWKGKWDGRTGLYDHPLF